VGAPKDRFAWTQGDPAIFESTNLAKRAYCRHCGTPLSFAYSQPDARFYVTIGSLDAPETVPIIIQYGVEGRIPWVKCFEDVKAERTAEDAKTAAFFAKMQSHQG
jgi:hypothetical protein